MGGNDLLPHILSTESHANATSAQLHAIVAAQRDLVAAATDPERVMALAVELARRVTSARTSGLFIPSGEWLVRRAASGYALPAPLRIRPAGSLTGQCFRTGETLSCADTQSDPRADRESCRSLGVRSIAVTPLNSSRGSEGVLVVSSERIDAFSPADVKLLEMLGGVGGAALEVATLFQRAERSFKLEQSVVTILANASSAELGAADCVGAIGTEIGWDCGAFWALSRSGKAMRCVATWGDETTGTSDFLHATRSMTQTRKPGGMVRRAWLERSPVWVEDITQEASFSRREAARAAGLCTAFAYPLMSADEVIGVLEFFGRTALPPDTELLSSSRSLGSQIGHLYQRCEAREHLRESEERYQYTIELAPIGISHIDPQGSFIHVNGRICEMLGYTREELLGKSTREITHPDDRHLTTVPRARMHAGEIRSFQIEKRCVRKDGEIFWVALTVAVKRDAAGKPLHDIAVTQDITPAKRAEEQLALTANQLMQADKMSSVGLLAAGVAHEINNPIGYVNSNFGTLGKYHDDLFRMLDAYEGAEKDLPAEGNALATLRRRKEELDLEFLREDLTALMAESREGITRVKKIVQDLKDFSHADTKDEWQTADLHRGLDTTLNIAHNEIKYKGNVVKDYGTLPEIECLPSQLNQVFMNLIVNAAHAIEAHGTITLRTSVHAEDVCVEVTDTGAGIPKDVLARIFDPFFTTKPIGKGTGLGLSLSYGIVKKHGGRIEVESAPGTGTTFRVFLPQKRPAPVD